MNITEPIRFAARITPRAAAIIRADGTAISYAVLDHAIDRMTVYAARLGLRAGDIASIAIIGPDEAISLTLALALARIGVATAEPRFPAELRRLCFQVAADGEPVQPGNVRVDSSWMTYQPAPPETAPVPEHADPDAICRVFSSSGTTGTSKHVPVSHAWMVHRAHARLVCEGGGRAVRIIAIGMGGSWGFPNVLRTLWQGGTIVLSNPTRVAETIERHGVTSIIASPLSLRTILDYLPPGAGPFASLDAVEVGGSLLAQSLLERAMARLCPNIVSILGAAETGGTASAPMAVLGTRPNAVGFTYPDVTIEAVDAEGHPLPRGTEGLLRIRGDGVARMYLGDDPESSRRFRDGWFWSADIGAVWPDGMVTLGGRDSDLINSGGVKVTPETIERALLRLPTVADAAAFGVPDDMGIERVWAAIAGKTRIDDKVLEAFCSRVLKDISPDVILQLKDIPRNENGKIRRDQLIDLARTLTRKKTGG